MPGSLHTRKRSTHCLRCTSYSAIAMLFAWMSAATARANCTAADFAAAVDASGASLRTYTLQTQPKLQEAMRRYKEAKKLNDTDYQNIALDAIQDATLEKLDQQSSELIMKVDTLGRVEDGKTPDCAKLDEIKAASLELLAVVKAKSEYMQARLNAASSQAGGSSKTPEASAAKPGASKSAPAEAAPKQAAAPQQPNVVAGEPSKKSGKPASTSEKSEQWSANTRPNDAFSPAPEGPSERTPSAVVTEAEEGYSIDEIKDATRGFFGTISTNLASVIEHVFEQSGRPSAYVLGTEGGGAFLAGLRYGKGTLYMRNQSGTRSIYWHGPSVGTDFGASGARTMFLIYKMREPNQLYRSFTGVDGSAFFVGGVGVTLLKGGEVLMAPIRTGLGFRLGANLGYVKFTDHPTWNPF